MATNTSTPEQRKIVSVEILHLDEKGYGPKGEHTRREWRKECLDNLLAGKDKFLLWQRLWIGQIDNSMSNISFEYQINFADGSYELVKNRFTEKHRSYSLDFVGQTFINDLNAEEFTFLNCTLFSGAKFNNSVHLRGAKFNDDAYFDSAFFISVANFISANFNVDSYFDSAIFYSSSNFISVKMNGVTYFSDTNFIGFANFSNTIFSGNTYYRNSRFGAEGAADFPHTTFEGFVDFSFIKFNSDVDFRNSKFNDDVDFSYNLFNKSVNFSNATFSRNTFFRSVKFGDDVNFSKTQFKSLCHFDNVKDYDTKEWNNETRFNSAVDFENATFDNVGHFERVRFTKETPKFRGCKIGDTRLEFSDDSYFPQDEKGEDAVKNISFLKRLAEEHGQTEQALNFNAMELRAKAASDDASWNFIIVTWFYKHVSDFGRSFLRPLTVYAIILFITFLIALEHSAFNAPRTYTQNGCEKYVWWIERVTWVGDKNCQRSDKEKNHKLTGIRAAGEYTLYRAVGVLDFADSDKQTIEVANRLFAQDYEPWWMRIYGIFKAIASTALLFLTALGLRNKYRIK